VIDREGRLVAQHDFDAIQRVLGVPVANIVRMAKHGWWIVAPPALDRSGERARIETAGKVLLVDLNDGRLSLQD
jgi:hypothetical protein